MAVFTPKQLKAIRSLATEFQLELILLFGSHARGKTHAKSDVDFAVQPKQPLSLKTQLSLQSKLEDIVGSTVDVVDLKTVPILLGDRIARDAIVIVGDIKAFQKIRDILHVKYMDYGRYFKQREERLYQQFGVVV